MARVFRANHSAGKRRTYAIIDYFLSLNQRGSKWQVSNLLRFPLLTFQIHTADQLPPILFTEVFLGSVKKPFSIITSDYIKFPVQNSLTKCTSPMYQRRNSYPRVRSWAITFSLLNCVPPSYPPMLTTTFRLLHC